MGVFVAINHFVLVQQDPPGALIQTDLFLCTCQCENNNTFGSNVLHQELHKLSGLDGSQAIACLVCSKHDC